jgi:2-polyprenyl-3-methyl-5-hydroxy-6-metoxy-1,4-benzoquinol methylase
MSFRDLGYWVQNARTDLLLARLERESGSVNALERLYERHPDPWASLPRRYRYQRRKYDALLSMIPARRYPSVLDIGCGVGALARDLAPHADRVLGVDLSRACVEHARQISIGYPNLQFAQAEARGLDRTLDQQFDLVLLIEVLYYLSPPSKTVLDEIRRSVENLLAPGGILLLVNHSYLRLLPASRMTPLIHDRFCGSPWLHLRHEQWRPFYLASLFHKEP